MKKLTLIICLLVCSLLNISCEKKEFVYVRVLSDTNFKDEVIYDQRPAVVLFHPGMNSGRTIRLIEPFETFARTFNGQVRFFAYDMSTNKKFGHDYRIHRNGSTLLFYNGEMLSKVIDYLKNDNCVLARLYMLTDVFIVEDNPLGKQIEARELSEEHVDQEILETNRLVVIAFDRLGPGEDRGTFEPQLSELSMRYGSFITFFKVHSPVLRNRFAVGYSQALLVYKNGREVERYTGPLYANSMAMKTLMMSLVLPHVDGCETLFARKRVLSPSPTAKVSPREFLPRGPAKTPTAMATKRIAQFAALFPDESHLFSWKRKANRTRKRR